MALFQCDFYSDVLQIAASMNVILPQNACLKGNQLPTLYLLHGLSDDHTIWQRRTSIERYVEPLGLAVVMPGVNRSFYADMEYGARYWEFVCNELPALARGFFPLSAERMDSVRFRTHAEKLGLDLTYEEGPGEHEWGYWDQQIQKVLSWLPMRKKK